jgi:hypothetical protein
MRVSAACLEAQPTAEQPYRRVLRIAGSNINKERNPGSTLLGTCRSGKVIKGVWPLSNSFLADTTESTMSTPMCDDFYSGEMSDYSCLQRYNGFEDKPTFGDGVDPRLLSSPNSPMMSSEHGLDQFNQGTQHMLQDNFEPFSDMAPPQHQHQQQHHPAFFDQDMSLSSYKPLRHQMLGHRRSVSVPPEDFAAEVSQHPPPPQPAMVFHRGGTPLGDSMGTCKGGNKRWLKKASAAAVSQQQKRRHQPYPSMQNIAAAQSPSVRVGMKRSQTQPTGSLHGPTSAPVLDHMHYTREVGHGVSSSGLQFDMNAQTLPQFTEFDMVYPDITTTTNADLKNGIAGVPTTLIDIDSLLFGSRGHADSAVLGMLGFADRIARDCEAMRSFLGRGYKGVDRNDDDDELERYVLLCLLCPVLREQTC